MPIGKLKNKKWKRKKKGNFIGYTRLMVGLPRCWGVRFISILTRNFIAYSSHFTFFIWRGTHLSVCFWRNRSGFKKIRRNSTNTNFLVSLSNSMLTKHISPSDFLYPLMSSTVLDDMTQKHRVGFYNSDLRNIRKYKTG